jgi:hypothetical protein
MGYKPTKKVYELSFTDFPGLEIDAVSTSLGKLMRVGELNVRIDEPDQEKRMELFSIFTGCIARWNMEHPALPQGVDRCANCNLVEDDPMPVNVTSLLCLDLDFIMPIIFGWVATISRVSVPKELSLSDGGRSIPEEVMKLLGQHPNLSTLPAQSSS